jgi:hypothetical protein
VKKVISQILTPTTLAIEIGGRLRLEDGRADFVVAYRREPATACNLR